MLVLHGVGEAERAVAERRGGGGVTGLDDLAVGVKAQIDRGRARTGIGGLGGKGHRDAFLHGIALFVDIFGGRDRGTVCKRGDGRILGLPQHAHQVGHLGLLSGGGACRVLAGVVLGKVAHVSGLLLGLGLLHHGAAGLVPQLEGEIPQRAGEHHEQGHDEHEHAADATRLLKVRMLHRLGFAVAATVLDGRGGGDLVAEHGLVARLEALHRIGIIIRGIALVAEAGGMRAVGRRNGRERLG